MKNALLFLILTMLWACGGTPETAEQSDNMAQFTNDESFKNAHELPEEIDFAGKGKMITFATPDGQKGSAYAVQTETPSNKYLFVIHEWYGLNDHIKQEADRLFGELEDVQVLALDIYDGKVADNRDDASKYMQSVTEERANAIIQGAITLAGTEAKVATIGWCFGGGWSLKSSILLGEQGAGCVMYYGMPVKEAEQLMPLQAEVLGIFAEKEKWITPEVVNEFKTKMDALKKPITVHQFPAEHAFANPSSPRYNEAAATEANKLARAFLRKKLGSE